ncbi:MAG: DUF1592 domain-containing protein [Pseudomonadota bacterium]
MNLPTAAYRIRGLVSLLLLASLPSVARATDTTAGTAETAGLFLKRYCSRCHDDYQFSGNWSLSDIDLADLSTGNNLELWEKILRQSWDGSMPPADRKQPQPKARESFVRWLRGSLDRYTEIHPDPGPAPLRRLNRSEYANAVRDLLKVERVPVERLPADDAGFGFDNIAELQTVSATLLESYLAVAAEVSRRAIGLGVTGPVLTTYSVPKDGSILNSGIPAGNERVSNRLPLDSRGGGVFRYTAPLDGTYEISGYLNANTNNEVDRLEETRHAVRVSLPAGPHDIGMSFRKQLALDESIQTLVNTTDIVPLPTAPPTSLTLDFIVDGARVDSTAVPSYHWSERYAQQRFPRDVLQIDVEGPFDPSGPGNTASRAQIFSCYPNADTHARDCAASILARLARQATRRRVTPEEVEALLAVFDLALANEGFEPAIGTAVQALLVSPSFLFVVEHPAAAAGESNPRIDDYALATRLALFLWSSLPDERLLRLADENALHQTETLRAEVQRMLADPRASALTENFAGQWLYLRNLEHHRPDVFRYGDFDVALRHAVREETERFFAGIVRENRSVLEFLDADYSFLNERLAKHYGIPGVYGTQLRRVELPEDSARGGVLGQASLLTLTSYGNHTSVVRRGQWILDALLGAPPPPAPPDVPALMETKAGQPLNARDQLIMHRQDPACAACHVRMDPLGLALENYDAIGAFRLKDAGQLIDASAELPDGSRFHGLPGLKEVLLARKDQFTHALTEQLMIYALGRGLEAQDQPWVRRIAERTAKDGYEMHSILLGIIESYPFKHRRSAGADDTPLGASE